MPDFEMLIPFVCTGLLFGLMPPASIPPGSAPPNAPQPGTPGGGGLPASNLAAAALVPPGLLAVAVFPPFEIQPPVPVQAVIFSEDRPSRVKRDIYDGYYDAYDRQYQPHYQYEKPSIFDTVTRCKINLYLCSKCF